MQDASNDPNRIRVTSTDPQVEEKITELRNAGCNEKQILEYMDLWVSLFVPRSAQVFPGVEELDRTPSLSKAAKIERTRQRGW